MSWTTRLVLLSLLGTSSTSQAIASVPIPHYLLEEARPRHLKTGIPIEVNDSTEYWVRQFSGPLRDRFAAFMERGAVYKTKIQDLLKNNRLPPELYYLVMIESGFINDATSRVRAVGFWQFMRPTAVRYGLRADRIIDERLDIVHSTQAACRYLRDLRRQFGNWNLAMAAYNAGEGRVRRAVRNGGNRNFWLLTRDGLLPYETSQYVPQFQAAMQIASNPEKYGFESRAFLEYPKLRKLKLKGRMTLADAAKKSKTSLEAIRALNPHVLQVKGPIRHAYEIWIPATPTKKKLSRKA